MPEVDLSDALADAVGDAAADDAAPAPFDDIFDNPPAAPAPTANRNLFVGNINWAMSDDDLAGLFGEHGPLLKAIHVEDKFEPGRKRGFGFVEFERAEDAAAAHAALNGAEVDGRTLRVDWSEPRVPGVERPRREFAPRAPREPALDNGRRLYVGNLDYRTQDETLAELFAEFGTVESAQHLADRENPDWKRGFGFVTLSTEAEANAAADAMNGAEVDGRVIKVNIAKPR